MRSNLGLRRAAAIAFCLGLAGLWAESSGKTQQAAPGLHWPLEIPPAVVSSFGEYRYDHLHAGLDISTRGATGLAVRAAADGHVARLKVEWRGYGRALYLRHADGRTTVYGHLKLYEEPLLKLESLVAQRRKAAGTRYPGDIFPDPPIPVRRGQVIAYSGESGVGLPHLHFEVRGSGDQPIDPFQAGLRHPSDLTRPRLEAVTLDALVPDTFIDGQYRRRTYDLRPSGGRLEPAMPVRVSGPFRATLSAYDPMPGGGRGGLRYLAVKVDGRPFYRLAFDSFRFDQYPISGLIHDHRLSHLGPTRFGYRLARLPGNVLADGGDGGAVETGSTAGAFDLAQGGHVVEIEARDAAGNATLARLTVERVGGPVGNPESRPEPSSNTSGSPATRLQGVEFLPGFIDLRAALSPSSAGTPGAESAGCSLTDRISWKPLQNGDLAGGLDYQSLADPTAAAGSGLDACLRNVGVEGRLVRFVGPDEAVRIDGGRFRIELPVGARFFPGPLAVRSSAATHLQDGLTAILDAVDILPEGEALNARATIEFDLAAAEGEVRRIGIYRFDPDADRWSFEGDSLRAPARVMTLPFRRYGRFALLLDDSPPRIKQVRPRSGATDVSRRPDLWASVEDTGKGIDHDGVAFVLDGAPIASEFDPDRGVSRPLAVPSLAAGAHRLKVVVTDRAGNVSQPVEIEFRVR